MPGTTGPPDLCGLLNGLADAGREGKEVSIRDIRNALGRRSFAPLLLATSLMGFTPLGAVPGMPTMLAVIIVVIATQIALGQNTVWLPQMLLDRKVEGRRVTKSAKSLLPAARFIDKGIKPRLTWLTERPSSYIIAIVCILIAMTVPPLELVPFVDLPLWAALVAFSLALAAHDGLLAIAAFVLTATGLILTLLALL